MRGEGRVAHQVVKPGPLARRTPGCVRQPYNTRAVREWYRQTQEDLDELDVARLQERPDRAVAAHVLRALCEREQLAAARSRQV